MLSNKHIGNYWTQGNEECPADGGGPEGALPLRLFAPLVSLMFQSLWVYGLSRKYAGQLFVHLSESKNNMHASGLMFQNVWRRFCCPRIHRSRRCGSGPV